MVWLGRVNFFNKLLGRRPQPAGREESASFKWPGQSGAAYSFTVCALDAVLKPLPGVYIYARQTEDGGWIPIFIAQTRDLHQRLEGHVHLNEAVAAGATHLHAHYCTTGQSARCEEERDLIRQWTPVCNEAIES